MKDELNLDGWALWQEHRPQSGEDWRAVARRCLADDTFDVSQSSPLFAALYAAEKDLRDASAPASEPHS